jgi:hypothetical protein
MDTDSNPIKVAISFSLITLRKTIISGVEMATMAIIKANTSLFRQYQYAQTHKTIPV